MGVVDVVAARVGRLRRRLGDDALARVHGGLPPGFEPPPPPPLPEDAERYAHEAVRPALADLEDALPLRRDPGGGVWEGMVLGVVTDRAWLTCRNLLGAGERLHVFHPDRSRRTVRSYAEWFAARDTPSSDTSWDAARSARRVVLAEDLLGRRPMYLDPGAVRIVEIAMALGASTLFSCEGHPLGGYLVMRNGPGARLLARSALRLGWLAENEASRARVTIRMPSPRDLAERDAAWRGFCHRLEALHGLTTEAGRDLLDRINLHRPQAPAAAPQPAP